MDALVCNDQARAGGVLNRELGLARLASKAADAACHVLSAQSLLRAVGVAMTVEASLSKQENACSSLFTGSEWASRCTQCCDCSS